MNTTMAAPGIDLGNFGAFRFMVEQMLSRVNTMTLVEVVSCSDSDTLAPVGFVDVQVLVNMLDGAGNGYPIKGTLHNLPYLRLQGGSNAIIIKPKAGDIGIAGFCSRDISKVKTTKKQANPGSWATHSLSDGLYFGGVLNGIPTSYFQFLDNGDVKVHTPGALTISAASIASSGSWEHTGTIKNNGHAIGSDLRVTGIVAGGAVSGVPV